MMMWKQKTAGAHRAFRSPLMTGLPMWLLRASLLLAVLIGLSGCQMRTASSAITSPARSLAPSILIPRDVQRIAVLYPKSSNPEVAEAYNRLEGATFLLKANRPTLKIVDRFNLSAVLDEHRFQHTGAVAEDSAIRIGRVLGVDSVLIYRIDGPSVRDRLWASEHSDLPPVTVTSKLIRVESAEVLYHNVVTAPFEDSDEWDWLQSESFDYRRLSREALERGIVQTVLDLERAFE
jgi:hypothetical protein